VVYISHTVHKMCSAVSRGKKTWTSHT